MRTLTRRAMLMAGATASLALSIAGCSLLQNLTPTQIQADVTAVANGLSGIVSALTALPNNPVPADVIAKVQTAIDTIRTNADKIAGELTPSTSTLQTIAGAVSLVATLLTPFFPMAPAIAAVVQAAVSLIGFVLVSAGVTTLPKVPKGLKIMPADQARVILLNAATTGVH